MSAIVKNQKSKVVAFSVAVGLAGFAAFGHAGNAAAETPAVSAVSSTKLDITTGAGSMRTDARRIDLKATSLYGLPNVQ